MRGYADRKSKDFIKNFKIFAHPGLTNLDYCSGLHGGATKFLIGWLSGILRATARFILLLPRTVWQTRYTMLPWLDISCESYFQALAHLCLHGLVRAPSLCRSHIATGNVLSPGSSPRYTLNHEALTVHSLKAKSPSHVRLWVARACNLFIDST